MLEDAITARDRRDDITKLIKNLIKSSKNADPANSAETTIDFNKVADYLSDPTSATELIFPYIDSISERFNPKGEQKIYWQYVGREKFAQLLEELREVRESTVYKKLWLYGTQGYGKSHLLAALVCYLTAQGEPVVFIPDCRACRGRPVTCFKKAMLFAWTDDATQQEILALNTMAEIMQFLDERKGALIVIDQMNILTEVEVSNADLQRNIDLVTWIDGLAATHRMVLSSSSANYLEYLQRSKKQTTEHRMRVYGGFTKVCGSKSAAGIFLIVLRPK